MDTAQSVRQSDRTLSPRFPRQRAKRSHLRPALAGDASEAAPATVARWRDEGRRCGVGGTRLRRGGHARVRAAPFPPKGAPARLCLLPVETCEPRARAVEVAPPPVARRSAASAYLPSPSEVSALLAHDRSEARPDQAGQRLAAETLSRGRLPALAVPSPTAALPRKGRIGRATA